MKMAEVIRATANTGLASSNSETLKGYCVKFLRSGKRVGATRRPSGREKLMSDSEVGCWCWEKGRWKT
jgi:hypothetical protein